MSNKLNAEKLAKVLQFENQDDYFEYIFESFTNGQYKQTKNLWDAMNKASQKEFLLYCITHKNALESLTIVEYVF